MRLMPVSQPYAPGFALPQVVCLPVLPTCFLISYFAMYSSELQERGQMTTISVFEDLAWVHIIKVTSEEAYRKSWTLDAWSGRLDCGHLDSGRLDSTLDTCNLDT